VSSPRRKRAARPSDAPRVIAYLRVSTEQQAESGGGIGAQRAAIDLYCQAQGWDDVRVVADPAWSAKTMNRPELDQALAELSAGRADVLIAKDLSRVSRSVADFAALLNRAEREGWRLVLIDIGIDTSTPAGKLVAHTIAGTAQYEREVISQRTRDALAAKRAGGVRLGRPSVLPLDVVRRIVDERSAGRGLRVIAEGLTADGIPTARGKAEWSTSSVQAVLAGQDAAKLAAAG
jgi:DNA invertase Pin-like site-specific DNA recombinase